MNRSTLVRWASRKGTVSAWARHFAAALGVLLFVTMPAHAEPSQTSLLRLAEILGAVHHLREVCGAHEGSLWRDRMITLLEITEITEEKRQALISRFNSGFHRAEQDYPVCTSRAAQQTNALLDEGHDLASSLASDFSFSSNAPPASEATN